MNEFSKRHMSFDTSKLIKILEESNKYEQRALVSAKKELIGRGFSEDDLNTIIQGGIIDLQNSEIDELDGYRPELNSDSLFETIDVADEYSLSQEDYKKWKFLFYFILMLSAFYLYQSYPTYLNILDRGFIRYNYPISTLVGDFVFFYGLYLFWQKKRVGWIIMAAMYISDGLLWLYYWFDGLFYSTFPNHNPWLLHLEYGMHVFFSIGFIWIFFRHFLFRIHKIYRQHIHTMLAVSIAIFLFYLFTSKVGW